VKIELEEVVQLPQLNATADLGVVTLRADPTGDGTLFTSDQNGVIYRIQNGKAAIFFDMRTLPLEGDRERLATPRTSQ